MRVTTLTCDSCGAEAREDESEHGWANRVVFRAAKGHIDYARDLEEWGGELCPSCREKRIEAPIRAIVDAVLKPEQGRRR